MSKIRNLLFLFKVFYQYLFENKCGVIVQKFIFFFEEIWKSEFFIIFTSIRWISMFDFDLQLEKFTAQYLTTKGILVLHFIWYKNKE